MSVDQYAYSKYNREVKKLPQDLRQKVVSVQEEIAEDPSRGKPLKGSLKGWRSYGFTHSGNSYRIAYKVEADKVIFGSVGTRQGFYEELKEFD